MSSWLINTLATVGTLLLSLTVTLIFNKIVGIPRVVRQQRDAEREREEHHRQGDLERDNRIAALQTAVDALPSYRAQSLQIQEQLQTTDREILNACAEIKDSMLENRAVLNERLDRLERREKNALRQKILQEHRIFTDESMNPMRAWTEMEHHSFFELVRDYEELGGNDYVHSEVLPAMNRLRVIPMSDRNTLYELMSSRRL
jgi:hypothetical protein